MRIGLGALSIAPGITILASPPSAAAALALLFSTYSFAEGVLTAGFGFAPNLTASMRACNRSYCLQPGLAVGWAESGAALLSLDTPERLRLTTQPGAVLPRGAGTRTLGLAFSAQRIPESGQCVVKSPIRRPVPFDRGIDDIGCFAKYLDTAIGEFQ